MKNLLINLYNKHAYTHNYIFGYAENGKVYSVYTTSACMPAVLKLDRASRGQGYSIRFKATVEAVEELKKHALKIELLCSESYLEEVAATLGKRPNRGDAFEKLNAEKHGLEWTCSGNAKFWEAPDLTIDGIDYQVKYAGATFTNEATMQRLEAARA